MKNIWENTQKNTKIDKDNGISLFKKKVLFYRKIITEFYDLPEETINKLMEEYDEKYIEELHTTYDPDEKAEPIFRPIPDGYPIKITY